MFECIVLSGVYVVDTQDGIIGLSTNEYFLLDVYESGI